jgi:hypothetical protein
MYCASWYDSCAFDDRRLKDESEHILQLKDDPVVESTAAKSQALVLQGLDQHPMVLLCLAACWSVPTNYRKRLVLIVASWKPVSLSSVVGDYLVLLAMICQLTKAPVCAPGGPVRKRRRS